MSLRLRVCEGLSSPVFSKALCMGGLQAMEFVGLVDGVWLLTGTVGFYKLSKLMDQHLVFRTNFPSWLSQIISACDPISICCHCVVKAK